MSNAVKFSNRIVVTVMLRNSTNKTVPFAINHLSVTVLSLSLEQYKQPFVNHWKTNKQKIFP